MAIHRGIRTHQYLDDWLVRARSQHICLQHTQILVKMCQDLGWLVNLEKSELEPKQVFDFVGYQFDLRSGRVRPTPDPWQSLQDKLQALLLLPACPVRQFMSLIGLLTTTEKQVHLGRLHMRPIQWHLKSKKKKKKKLEGTRNFYRRIKRRVGRSLKRVHCKRVLVGAGKQVAHKLSGTKSSVPSLKRV